MTREDTHLSDMLSTVPTSTFVLDDCSIEYFAYSSHCLRIFDVLYLRQQLLRAIRHTTLRRGNSLVYAYAAFRGLRVPPERVRRGMVPASS